MVSVINAENRILKLLIIKLKKCIKSEAQVMIADAHFIKELEGA